MDAFTQLGGATLSLFGLVTTGVAAAPIVDHLPDVTATGQPLPAAFWVLAALAVVADLRPLPMPDTNGRMPTVFLSVCFTFAIALLWGPLPAIAVQTVTLGYVTLRRGLSPRWLLFTLLRFAAAFVAADIVLDLLSPAPTGTTPARVDVLAAVAAAATWFVVGYAILIARVVTRHRAGWRYALSRTFGYELLANGAILLLGPILVGTTSAWAILLVAVPVWAVTQLARRAIEQERQLQHDALTGLLGRRGLTVRIGELIDTAPREPFALMLLDLDRFKTVNDTLGHVVGDRLLRQVARRLTRNVRPNDMVARLGGDEFAVIAPGVAGVAEAHAFAGRVARALAEPVHLDGLPLDVSASFGVSLYPEHGSDVTTLTRHADVAMYQAKHAAAIVMVYSPQFDTHSPERLSLLADLRGALRDPQRRSEIQFHYQPQIAVATGEVVGLEALFRWQHPTRGLVSPDEVVPVAEHSSVMRLLTWRAFDDVVAQLATWNADGLRMRVSVNVSVRDLHTPDLADHLKELFARRDVRPDQIEVEITETALMADPPLVMATIMRLSDLGVRLAVDDMGAGYSALYRLRQLPVSAVKIDRSIMQNLIGSVGGEAVVRSIVTLAHTLDMRAVAEGIENETSHQMLVATGCDVGQGWHYAPAMPPAHIRTWLAGRPLRTPPSA